MGHDSSSGEIAPTDVDVARLRPKTGKILALYSCKKACAETKICLSTSVRHLQIKN
jgi:hypothetical protein